MIVKVLFQHETEYPMMHLSWWLTWNTWFLLLTEEVAMR